MAQSVNNRFAAGWTHFVRGWPTALLRQWPLLVVLACVGAGVGLVFELHWKRGAMMIGGAAGLAALLRLVLPEETAGLLVVRSKVWDVIITGGAGLAIVVLALLVPPL